MIQTTGEDVGNYKRYPTFLQKFMNFHQQTTKNRTFIFTHPPQIRCSASLQPLHTEWS